MAWLQARVVDLIVHIWRWFRVFWVCRVPALSAVGGGLLMSMVPQARDLFADTGLDVVSWAFFFACVTIWAWVVHMMARRALQYDEWVPAAHASGGLSDGDRERLRKAYEIQATWMPRMLGLSVFAFIALALWITRVNLLPATGLTQAAVAASRIPYLLAATFVCAAVYLFVVVVRRSFSSMLGHETDPHLLARAQSIIILIANPRKNWPILKRIFSHKTNQILALLGLGIFVSFAVAVVAPAFLSDWVPRALFLPVLLGGGLFLFGEIASLSHRWQTPLLLVFVIAGGLLGYLLEHYNDVRWIGPGQKATAGAAARQATIGEAIEAWKAVNCSQTPCEVRPIVIAGAGGASRAGFFTATVVGALMDASGKPAAIRNRIFALSTVSGSSVGAAMMRAAWMDALESPTPDLPPCRKGEVSAWFGGVTLTEVKKGESPWRDCFQKLMAGDFLSTVFVGIAYRDIFPVGGLFDANALDRSGLLQDAFERWYMEMVEGSARGCTNEDVRGLCRAVGHLPIVPAQAGQAWVPLLFINGTSVTTGRRIIVSDVRVDCFKKKDAPFLNLAYDASELRGPRRRSASPLCEDNTGSEQTGALDMTLSSAAMMSARFPIISTHGTIRAVGRTGRIVDAVVDGGYFENDGLATTADVVRELQEADLKPIVIKVTNDPVSVMLPPPGSDTRPPLPRYEGRAPFDAYTTIGRALYATRSGHEDGHLDYLRGTLAGPLVEIGVGDIEPTGEDADPEPHLCRLSVKSMTAMETVSMSWWMSQPVQAYLDAQLCRRQAKRLACVLTLDARDARDPDKVCPVQ